MSKKKVKSVNNNEDSVDEVLGKLQGRFDKTIKKVLRESMQVFLEYTSEHKISYLEAIPAKVQLLPEKEVDFLYKVELQGGVEDLLQVEFQKDDDADMDNRMLGYGYFVRSLYGRYPIQILFSLGEEPPKNMKGFIKENGLKEFIYYIITLAEKDAKPLIESDSPVLLIMSILFKHENKNEQVAKILEKLSKIVKNKRQLNSYYFALEILAQLRNMQKEVAINRKKINLLFDITKDIRFIEGRELGMDEAILKFLKRGKLSIDEIAETLEISIEKVLAIKKEHGVV